jgi:uroporphyrinogen decarboxylase
MTERKKTMTERERIEALLRREKPDRVPIWPFASQGFAMVNTNHSIADGYNNPEESLAAQRQTAREYGWVFVPTLGYASMCGWEFGGSIKWPSGEFAQAPTVTSHVVETPEGALNLEMPDFKNSGIVPRQMKFYQLAAQERLDNEPFNVKLPGSGPFTCAGNIVGVENLARWMLKKPEAVHHLLKTAMQYYMLLARYWKDTFGIEGVLPYCGEATTSNQLISSRHFEQFALPYEIEIREFIFSLGYKHSYAHICGEQNDNLPHWSKVHFGDPGIISIGHEVELQTAARYFPNDIIVGNLEPAIIQACTPEEVYQATRKNIVDGMKIPGGYVFSPGCEMPPKSSRDNVMAMTQAVNDFGWYD